MQADTNTRSAIMAVIEKFNEAFTRHDIEGVMSFFAPDQDVVVIGSEEGEITIGPEELRARLELTLLRPENLGWSWQAHKVSLSGSGTVAWAAIDATLHMQHEGRGGSVPYRITCVLEKRDDAWLIVQWHGSEPARQLWT